MALINIDRINGVVTLRVNGGLNSLNIVGQMYDVLNELLYQGEFRVVMDLEKVEKVSNCGIGELLTFFYRKFMEKGGELLVRSPQDASAKKRFDELVLAGVQSSK